MSALQEGQIVRMVVSADGRLRLQEVPTGTNCSTPDSTDAEIDASVLHLLADLPAQGWEELCPSSVKAVIVGANVGGDTGGNTGSNAPVLPGGKVKSIYTY